MTGKIRVIAAVLSTEHLILYKEDTTSITIPKSDRRVRKIVDTILPILNAGGIATVDLSEQSEYAEFEKETNGLVRFFRVAKKAVAHLFGSDADRKEKELAAMTMGSVPVQVAAVDEILSQAVSSNSKQFSQPAPADSTMVAVVGSGKNAKIVPGVEALKDQLSHSVKMGSTIGVENLLRRLAAVVEKRGHSVQDVMGFLERGDLPITDSGDILAYKVLNKHRTRPDVFIDCHTGKVPQRVGSVVCVDESLVDLNRKNECSNGLHIARRGYIGNFPGDVCVLVKLAPEDVVTVPHNDPNKVRVCRYLILGVLPDEEFSKLKVNRPMSENSVAQRLLAQGISGNHVARLEEVRITKQRGEGVVVTRLSKEGVPEISREEVAAVTNAVALDDEKANGSTNVREVNKAITAAKSKPMSPRTQEVRRLLELITNLNQPKTVRKSAAQSLLDLKKRSKAGWDTLGVTEAQQVLMQDLLADPATAAPEPAKAPMSRAQQINELVLVVLKSPKPEARVSAAKQILDLKKKSKGSWSKLGIDAADTIIQIERLATMATPAPKATKTKTTVAAAPPIGPVLDPKGLKTVNAKGETKMVGADPVKPGMNTRQAEAARLYARMTTPPNDRVSGRMAQESAATALRDFKKKAKVSWSALLLPDNTAEQITAVLKTTK